jgi:tripartite-type tricarboxylate transporter receptor subunit TctC
VPIATPKDIVTKLREALLKVRDQPSTRQSFERRRAEVVKSTPVEFARRLQADYTKWGAHPHGDGILTLDFSNREEPGSSPWPLFLRLI